MLCVETFDHLMQLHIADMSAGTNSMEIDVLIGSDYYWELVTGKIRTSECGPIAVNTQMGWVLSGSVLLSGQEQQSSSLISTHTLKVRGLLNP